MLSILLLVECKCCVIYGALFWEDHCDHHIASKQRAEFVSTPNPVSVRSFELKKQLVAGILVVKRYKLATGAGRERYKRAAESAGSLFSLRGLDSPVDWW